MKENQIKYTLLTPSDKDIPLLLRMHTLPEIYRYIAIDRDNYFNYVTGTEDVFYHKVYSNGDLAASVHSELADSVLYISIFTFPEYQRRGIATQILEDVKAGRLIKGFRKITAYIDSNNIPSVKLFEQSGFILRGEDEGTEEYEWTARDA